MNTEVQEAPPTSSFSTRHSLFDILTIYFHRTTDAAPLAVFRILFGVMMVVSLVRVASYGWIDKLYIQPQFFFSYYGFEWVRPLGPFTYLIFAVCGLAALMVAFGYHYRVAIITFFLSFTYIELMDKTTYLNHYYFISALSFLMIWLPANAYFSVDARRHPERTFQRIPRWTIDAIKLLLGIVYFYAGLAKLNSDWLVHAQPLSIWLPASYDLPLLGNLLEQRWVHYAFSWGGMLYDLSIPFLLLWRRTRWLAFALVVVFHGLTRVLFPIGMFPYVMIVSTLIFFDARLHHRLLNGLARLLKINKTRFDNNRSFDIRHSLFDIRHFRISNIQYPISNDEVLLRTFYRFRLGVVVTFFLIQLLLPFRYLLYPGELFWTEEGYRFSWRVMLMEKAGYAQFRVVDATTGQQFYVDNTDFLTSFQEKQMATQPDFMLQYAHWLADHFAQQGHQNVQVFVDSYVALNGRPSRRYVDPHIDLAQIEESFRPRTWLLPFGDTIQGL